jgi:hypothetical protein
MVERRGRKVLADMPLLDPLIYAGDNHYYKIGPAIGNAYSEGGITIEAKAVMSFLTGFTRFTGFRTIL